MTPQNGASFCGVPSGAILFAYTISSKNEKSLLMALKLKVDRLTHVIRMGKSICHKWVKKILSDENAFMMHTVKALIRLSLSQSDLGLH